MNTIDIILIIIYIILVIFYFIKELIWFGEDINSRRVKTAEMLACWQHIPMASALDFLDYLNIYKARKKESKKILLIFYNEQEKEKFIYSKYYNNKKYIVLGFDEIDWNPKCLRGLRYFKWKCVKIKQNGKITKI